MDKNKQAKKGKLHQKAEHLGTYYFEFHNGDIYKGEFYATVAGAVTRSGEGIYITHDKQQYHRKWLNDRLVDDASIFYADNSSYHGRVTDNLRYEGKATYVMQDKAVIKCNFHEGIPIGNMELIDPNGRPWRGLSDKQCGYFLPENKFPLAIHEKEGHDSSEPPPTITYDSEGYPKTSKDIIVDHASGTDDLLRNESKRITRNVSKKDDGFRNVSKMEDITRKKSKKDDYESDESKKDNAIEEQEDDGRGK